MTSNAIHAEPMAGPEHLESCCIGTGRIHVYCCCKAAK